jgi:hypothetical protein
MTNPESSDIDKAFYRKTFNIYNVALKKLMALVEKSREMINSQRQDMDHNSFMIYCNGMSNYFNKLMTNPESSDIDKAFHSEIFNLYNEALKSTRNVPKNTAPHVPRKRNTRKNKNTHKNKNTRY